MNLGDKVKIKGYYQRNSKKPRKQHEDNLRYTLVECNKEGFIVGKRNIHLAGYTDYDSDGGYYFCSQKMVTCWLVAISIGQCVYVPMDMVELGGVTSKSNLPQGALFDEPIPYPKERRGNLE